jgi:hypothetical protein
MGKPKFIPNPTHSSKEANKHLEIMNFPIPEAEFFNSPPVTSKIPFVERNYSH